MKIPPTIVVQRMRDALAEQACHLTLTHYANNRVALERSKDIAQFISVPLWGMRGRFPEISASTRRRVALAACIDHRSGMRYHQTLPKDIVSIRARPDFAQELAELSRKWWHDAGYDYGRFNDPIQGARCAVSEKELRDGYRVSVGFTCERCKKQILTDRPDGAHYCHIGDRNHD